MIKLLRSSAIRSNASALYISNMMNSSINVRFQKKDGSVVTVQGHEGACEGVCACSTCHVILEEKIYDSLPEPSEDEEDMLDQAFGLTATSRLSCQLSLAKKHENMLVVLPAATRNFYVDGHIPKPH